MFKFEKDPKKIQQLSIQAVKDSSDFSKFSPAEKEIAIQMLIGCGDLSILEQLRFSTDAIEKAMEILDDDFDLLCDSETVVCGLKQKYLKNEPICLISKASVISQAKSSKHTRSLVAVDLWKPFISESIVVIGKESTALSRLLELLEGNKDEENNKKPALIIATPVGFTNAEESKNYLWENHQDLGIPCITLLGPRGGSDIAVTAMNSLLKMQHNKRLLEERMTREK